MKRAEHQPVTVDVVIFGGIYCKLYVVPTVGTVIPQHSHSYDHVTTIMQGSVRVWCDDGPGCDYAAPAAIRIPAHTKHVFVTTEPETSLACIHNADRLEDDEPAVAEQHHLDLED